MLAECMLAVMRAEDKEDCGKNQLCGGLKAVVEGRTHTVQLLW